MKARIGSIVKREPQRKGANATWWARVTYIDPKTGKRHDLQRRGENKAHARDLLQALLREIDATEGRQSLIIMLLFIVLMSCSQNQDSKEASFWRWFQANETRLFDFEKDQDKDIR